MKELRRGSILETILKLGYFEAFAASIKIAGLENELSSGGPFTVFAPTNRAFRDLPQSDLDSCIVSRERLAEVIAFHVLRGEIIKDDIKAMHPRQILGTKRVRIARDQIRVNGARVVLADIICSNGVIHAIDSVLLPQWARIF